MATSDWKLDSFFLSVPLWVIRLLASLTENKGNHRNLASVHRPALVSQSQRLTLAIVTSPRMTVSPGANVAIPRVGPQIPGSFAMNPMHPGSCERTSERAQAPAPRSSASYVHVQRRNSHLL